MSGYENTSFERDRRSKSLAARRGNGLDAESFVPLLDIDPMLEIPVLDALGRARIAAFVEPLDNHDRIRLYAASVDRVDARTIVASVSRRPPAVTGTAPTGSTPTVTGPPEIAAAESATVREPVLRPDLLDGRDPNAEFDAMIADWHVDTVAAIRSAERDLAREDAEWRARLVPPPTPRTEDDDPNDEEHYVPPAPPPLPRLSIATVFALLVLFASIALLAVGSRLGLPGDLTFLLGVGGILLGSGLLVMRLRERPSDEDDDGAIL
ncbi:MAG: hypothetical protein JO147_03135 [Actinobacteria bacterium]|nr:hypothetical protein [Actinomycetota bacterium]